MKSHFQSFAFLIAGPALLAAIGCEQAPPPRFQLNMVAMVSTQTSDPYQQEIANVLAGMFGTPDEPYAFPESGLNQQRLNLAAGAAFSDQEGVSHGLYRKHCVHCHGITGDGRGPTARFLNPYPRDYRQGLFKFKNTYNNAKPSDEDLHRVMVNGIPGTAMPSFSLLPSSEIESLIEYVKYLAIRGEMEQKLADFVYSDLGETEKLDENGEPVLDEEGNPLMERIPLDPINDPEQAQYIKEELLVQVVTPWQEAADSTVVPVEEEIPADDRTPEEIAESVAKGRELFYGTKANCFTCHGPTGLGDGQQTDFDNWNKELNAFAGDTQQMAESLEKRQAADEISEEEQASIDRDYEELARRQAVVDTFYPIRNAIPRNLRKGVYRGGRRRIDIFSRVHQGIAGTPMPAVGPASPGGQGTLTESEIWNIVDYVLSLPYEELSNPQPALTLNEEPIAN